MASRQIRAIRCERGKWHNFDNKLAPFVKIRVELEVKLAEVEKIEPQIGVRVGDASMLSAMGEEIR